MADESILKKAQEIDTMSDEDLLEMMTNPDFFGQIPSEILSPLDQINKGNFSTMDFDFLEKPMQPEEFLEQISSTSTIKDNSEGPPSKSGNYDSPYEMETGSF
jgi:hypothetical protein